MSFKKIESRNIVHYDKDSDDLIISNREENEVVRKNFMFDDFIISVAGSGKIVGLEIRNVSEFLKNSDVDPRILEKLKSATLTVIPKKDFIFIGITFIFIDKTHVFTKKIPITHLPTQEAIIN